MAYAKAFFDLQLRFAGTVARLSGMPLARAVFEYTNFYIRFGAGRDFDAAHPIWQEYVAGLARARDPGEWTYRFYLARPESIGAPVVAASVGCFAYGRLGDDRIRLHFHNVERGDRSPLAKERTNERMAELAALFASADPTLHIVGASWLYNIEAYRRLFPPAYLATAHVLPGRFRHMPLWGQFLDRHGDVRETMTQPFIERLARASTLDELPQCFPFPVLTLDAPVSVFHEFYRV